MENKDLSKEIIYTRQYLYDRHRLSHQQIDRWFNSSSGSSFLAEKVELLDRVKKFLFVTDLLSKNNVSYVSIKGPLLSYKLYGDASVRFSHDIDLLIDLKDLSLALVQLEENGFHFLESGVWPKKKNKQEWVKKHLHHVVLYNKEINFCVELHWTLLQQVPIKQEQLLKIVRQNLSSVTVFNRTFMILNPELELLYLMLHGAKHAWGRLKWLVDINEYPLSDIDVERFNDLVHLFKAERVVAQTNALLTIYFKKNIPFAPSITPPHFIISYPQKFINKLDIVNLTVRDLLIGRYYMLLLFSQWSYKIESISGLLVRQGDLENRNLPMFMYYFYRPYSFIKRRLLRVK